MPKGAGRIIGRLIAGIVVFAALLLVAPPASAHGRSAGPSVDRHVFVQSTDTLLSAGEKLPGGCDVDMCCCILGQCSTVTIALSTATGAGYRPRRVATAYAGMVAAMTAGLRAHPATPPPRLDA